MGHSRPRVEIQLVDALRVLLLRKVDDARREVDERDALGLGDEGGALERWEPLAGLRGGVGPA